MTTTENGVAVRAGVDYSHWERAVWPASCLESEALFGQPHARLFPLLATGRNPYDGQPVPQVQTVRGPGRLLSVFADEAQVALDSDTKGKVVFLRPWEVWPLLVLRQAG
jgi:hypothetical protein